MMTERSEELEEYLATLEAARQGDDTAAQAAREQYRRKQRQAMGPPDVERAQELYRDGEVNEQELDALIESAMQYYPPDGKRESKGELMGVEQEGDPLDFALKVFFLTGIIILVALLLVELGQPPVDPNTVPI